MAYNNGPQNPEMAAQLPFRKKLFGASHADYDDAIPNEWEFSADNAAGTAAIGTHQPCDAADRFAILNPAGAIIYGPLVLESGTVLGAGTGVKSGDVELITKTVTISAADIVATAAGKLGHAAGYPLVADPGAGKAIVLVNALLSFTYGVAAYTAGGNITININGGAALTGLISAANSLGASADKLAHFVPLAAAAANLTVEKGLNLVAASAFTNPGTATGTVKVFVTYQLITL